LKKYGCCIFLFVYSWKQNTKIFIFINNVVKNEIRQALLLCCILIFLVVHIKNNVYLHIIIIIIINGELYGNAKKKNIFFLFLFFCENLLYDKKEWVRAKKLPRAAAWCLPSFYLWAKNRSKVREKKHENTTT
jgi:hypothetical protein